MKPLPQGPFSLPPKPHPDSARFFAILDEMRETHRKKSQDYGVAEAPLSNIEASRDFGVPAWVGALVRANDKMARLKRAASGGPLANEGVRDSLLDLACYVVIAAVLWERECTAGSTPTAAPPVGATLSGLPLTPEMIS